MDKGETILEALDEALRGNANKHKPAMTKVSDDPIMNAKIDKFVNDAADSGKSVIVIGDHGAEAANLCVEDIVGWTTEILLRSLNSTQEGRDAAAYRIVCLLLTYLPNPIKHDVAAILKYYVGNYSSDMRVIKDD